jgi:hypothetical protein
MGLKHLEGINYYDTSKPNFVKLTHWTAWVTNSYTVGAGMPPNADLQTVLDALSHEAELNGLVLPLDVMIQEDFSNFVYRRNPVSGEMKKVVIRG